MGKWRVTCNCVGGDYLYNVYRIRDTDVLDHSGNREYADFEWCSDRKKAEDFAELMNKKKA